MCNHCDIHRIFAARYRRVAEAALGDERLRFAQLAELHERHLADYERVHQATRAYRG